MAVDEAQLSSIAGLGLPVVRGVVVQGDQRGRQIGFPTANLALPGKHPRDGVWAGWLDCGDDGEDGLLPAAVSIGRRATFYGREGVRLLEAHVLDFDGSLYGRTVAVYLGSKLRGQRRFSSLEALVEQLGVDVSATRAWCEQPVNQELRLAAWERGRVTS